MNRTRITFDSKAMGGKSCICDMRVTVGAIIGLVKVQELDTSSAEK
jgi:uncharacterized protein (DUF433 family)